MPGLQVPLKGWLPPKHLVFQGTFWAGMAGPEGRFYGKGSVKAFPELVVQLSQFWALQMDPGFSPRHRGAFPVTHQMAFLS